jgi:hypothetical protein
MNVQSRPIRPDASPHVFKQSAVISAMAGVLRTISVLLIIASTFGNYVLFVGGWAHWTPINAVAVGFAILYQALCCVLQWGFKAARWWILYFAALFASAIPSFLTYNEWAGPFLAAQLGPVVALLAMALATLGADALPEWVLVE